MSTLAHRLEQYTLKRPQEVLLVTVTIAATPDQVLIFKGFSSSLMRPTEVDPTIAVLPDEAEIIAIDRLQGPYNPESPRYLDQGLTWEAMQSLLEQVGI